jgi:hypothetical protein
LAEFEAKVKETHSDNDYGKVYMAIIDVIKLRFANNSEKDNGDYR